MEIASNITSFLIGASSTYFLIFAIVLIKGRWYGKGRLQRLLGWIYLYMTFTYAKDMILTAPQFYNFFTLRAIIVADGWTALAYMALLLELAQPGWVTVRRMAIYALPFAAASVMYVAYPKKETIIIILAFLVIFGLYISVRGYRQGREYMRYIQSNYSNIDDVDITWIFKVYFCVIANLLLWLAASMMATPIVDWMYYVVSVTIWHTVYINCRDMRQVKNDQPKYGYYNGERLFPFAGKLESIIEQGMLYLNPTLSLDDLSKTLRTNRTYLSAYFSNVIGKSFYDYINEMRILKKSIPLMKAHPEYTLEYIAHESGYKSMSTFRRAFHKYKGMSPSEFRLQNITPAELQSQSGDQYPTV